jgi:ligand-binding sensor domain-containing protein/class 3 adenylate cyclase
MKKLFLIIFSLVLLFSCNTKHENKTINKTIGHDSLAPLQITVLSDLPESLHPKTMALNTLPKPRIVTVPISSGGSYSISNAKGEVTKMMLEPPVTKLLPVLLDAKGQEIKDNAGNTFIMGSGGVSNFSNFTTDNGLALDAIACSFKDKMGNLWFGSEGGGVSRYDGKSFTTFSTAQGLASNIVRSIAEDKTGKLWFGTYGGGVSRYDGKTFTTFSTAQGLADNNVNCITEDNKGNMWFGTQSGGACRYDGKSFTTFSIDQGLANNQISSIVEDNKGNMWFGTGGAGVSRYDGNCEAITNNKDKEYVRKSFTTFSTAQGLANNNVNCIAKDKMGNLWFGTGGGGVSRYDGNSEAITATNKKDKKYASKSFTTFTTAQGLANNHVFSIIEDRYGNMWFGTYEGGVSRYDGNCEVITNTNKKDKKYVDKAFTTFSTAQGLANNIVRSIVEDNAGNLWFGTYGGGVSRYAGKSFTSFSTTQGIADNNVNCIAEDKMGNLWFGTRGGGVSIYDGQSFTSFSAAQGLANNQVFSIAEDKSGNIWFGTGGGGVSRYDGNCSSITNTNKKDKKYVRKSFTTFTTTHGLANNIVRCIFEDRMGNIWFGTRGGGVSRYDGQSFTTFTTAQGLANNQVFSIAEDKSGNIWFGTYGGGVSRYDGNCQSITNTHKNDKKKFSKSFTTFTTAQGLASNQVFSIAEDKSGNIWFGTSEGLSVMSLAEVKNLQEKNEKGNGKSIVTPQIFKTFTKTEGLPDNFVTQVLQMRDGKMAVGTNLGITMFRPTADFSNLTDIELYNSNTGCPLKDVNVGQASMLLDSKGIIWAGTGSEKTALVRFDPSALHKNNKPPKLLIKSIKINEENICWYNLERKKWKKEEGNVTPANITEEVTTIGKVLTPKERDNMKSKFNTIEFEGITRFYPIPEHLVLPYKFNRITIDFNAIETSSPSLVNYQYMLEGYDKDWSPVLKISSATFGNMHEGSYIFKVKAQGPNGIWCAPVTYSFKVLPPLYRTWLAYGIYGILFLLALRIFIKWRERNLRMEKEKLENTVTIRTAEVVAEKKEVEKQKAVIEKEKQRSDDLLLNILPSEVAEELKAKGSAEAKLINEVTVLFTDFKGFTQLSEKLSPKELVGEINTCFSAFDHIMQKHGVEKIKTIGDAYMAAGGLPTPNKTHAEDVVKAALEIQDFMQRQKAEKEAAGELFFEIRIGVHTGPVVAGIVGIKKFAYDIWGDTVNTASRMESSGEVGKVNASSTTYELVKEKFNCTPRGKIQAKGKGEIDMYFVEGFA